MSRAGLGVVALTAALLLGACTGSDESSAPAATGDGGSGTTARGTRGAGPTPYLPVPDGVALTDPGSELGLGETAVVAFRPEKGEVGVLALTVRKVQRAPIQTLKDWQLDEAGRKSSLFYVQVTAENVGEPDLGGRRIPLYVADDRNSLVQSNTFKTEFKPCPSRALPETFATGDTTTACLVYLVPAQGRFTSVTFRPIARFNPITWVGQVQQPKKPKKPSQQ